jgi:glutathione S-transferase
VNGAKNGKENCEMIKLYGVVDSRALRCLWMLEELGVPYEQVPVTYRGGGTRTPDYLKVNPNGHVPAIQDNGTTLFESMAINLYLAMKYNKGMWPATLEDQARCIQWSVWGMTEVEPPALQVLLNTVFLPEDKREPAKLEHGKHAVQAPLSVLNAALEGKSWLVGNTFTVADLNVAAILSWLRVSKMEISNHPLVDQWLKVCTSRPALKQAQGKKLSPRPAA